MVFYDYVHDGQDSGITDDAGCSSLLEMHQRWVSFLTLLSSLRMLSGSRCSVRSKCVWAPAVLQQSSWLDGLCAVPERQTRCLFRLYWWRSCHRYPAWSVTGLSL